MSIQKRKFTKKIDFQTLESRRLLVAFGTPWPEARDLSISFPAEDVQIGSYQNNLHQTLDQVADRDEWQELALRAYQTWAVHADINIGLRNDFDVRFGAPGLMVNDPRFGEFRIGAMPQQGLLANSLPFQAVAGTYSGDLILNSNETFTYHDWSDGIGPDPDTINEGDRDLFSLLLHEAGNTLGLEDNLDTWSVMFRQYIAPKGLLSEDDIDEIQSLYGARSDPYESADNSQISVASLVPTPVGFDPASDVIQNRGSIANGADVDVYEFQPLAGQDSISIRLRTAGVSLLMAQMEIVDSDGTVLSTGSSTSVYDNDVTLDLSNTGQHQTLYLRVRADDADDIYSVGDYEIEIDYRDALVRASDLEHRQFDSGADALFTQIGLADDELGQNDDRDHATDLQLGTANIANRYETVSAVSHESDVDVYRISAPAEVDGLLRVNVAGFGLDHPDLKVQLITADGSSAGAIGRLHPDGTWTMEVLQPVANADYLIRVSVDPNSAVSVGNYIVTAEFEAPSEQMNELISGQLDHSADKFIRWTADKTKLFRFDLSASGGDAGEAVRLTIYDAHTREISMVLRTDSGANRSAFALLQQGDYILRFTALSQSETPTSTLAFSVAAEGLSDDQDDDGDDPDDDPDNDGYDYEDQVGNPSYDDGYDYDYEYYDMYDFYNG